MSLKTTIFSLLTADAGVVALVGTRVYPAKTPQKPTLPAVVYTTVSCVRDSSQDGLSGFVTTRVQFDCLSSSVAQAEAIATKVVQCLAAPHASAGPDDVEIFGAFADDQRDEWSDDLEVHIASVDITFEHREE